MLESSIDDSNYSQSKKGRSEVPPSFKPTISIMEGMDETVRSIGWQSKACFYYIDFNNIDEHNELITKEMISEFPYPPLQGSRFGGMTDFPVNSMVTEWHIVFLFESSLCVYSKITKEIVFNTEMGKGSAMLGMCTDNLLQNVWMHSNKKIFCLEFSKESKNIWLAYLKMNKYKDALNL